MLKLFVACQLVFVSSLVSALNIEQWYTKNGAQVLFVAANELPMIDVRLVFKAGSSRDGDLPGISRLVNALLVEGTGKESAESIAESMESVGAELGHDSLTDMAWTSLRVLSHLEKRDAIIDLYARVTAAPSFPKNAIERDRTSLLTSLKNRQDNIASVTSDAFKAALYKDHAYEIPRSGTKKGLESITKNDLNAFHLEYYVAKNASIVLVGDLTSKEATAMAESISSYLPTGKAAQPIPLAKATKRKTLLLDFDSTQTHIVKGLPVLTRHDPDYFSLYVGNHVFGGSGFGSRLMSVIREEKGLSYSVYSYFSPMEANGAFQMSMQTANHQVAESRDLLSSLLKEFIATGPTADELEKAKKNITGGFPLKIDSNKKIAEYLAVIGFYDLPLDYLDSFNAKVEQVTLAQIKDAFKRRVNLEQMVELVVGPLAN